MRAWLSSTTLGFSAESTTESYYPGQVGNSLYRGTVAWLECVPRHYWIVYLYIYYVHIPIYKRYKARVKNPESITLGYGCKVEEP